MIPKSIRDRLGVGPGDRILFEERDGEITVRAMPVGAADDPFAIFDEWAGEADERAYAEL